MSKPDQHKRPPAPPGDSASCGAEGKSVHKKAREIGGRKNGLEPTRYGDWEKNGRCVDF